MTDANPRCTVLSVDGIGAYDTISRRAMLSGLVRHMEGGDSVLPFVLQFYGSHLPSWWSTKTCKERAGNRAMRSDQASPSLSTTLLWPFKGGLAQDERHMAFLDDIYAVRDRPERSGPAYTAIQEALRTHTGH